MPVQKRLHKTLSTLALEALRAVQTGLRLSQFASLQYEALHVGTVAHVRVIGKGCWPRAASHARC